MDPFDALFNDVCAMRLAQQQGPQNRMRNRRQLDQLVRKTQFDRHELKMLYWGWKCACPDGVLTESVFKEIYSQFFPQAGTCCVFVSLSMLNQFLYWLRFLLIWPTTNNCTFIPLFYFSCDLLCRSYLSTNVIYCILSLSSYSLHTTSHHHILFPFAHIISSSQTHRYRFFTPVLMREECEKQCKATACDAVN